MEFHVAAPSAPPLALRMVNVSNQSTSLRRLSLLGALMVKAVPFVAVIT
jgi:hypothetical protein